MKENSLNFARLDSIESNLEQLNESIIKLQNKNLILQDSINTLAKTIEKAGIKTEIFTDQLSFQLFCFSIVLAILGLISWGGLFKPIKDQLKSLSDKKIPEIERRLFDEFDNRHGEFEKRFEKLEDEAYEGISWGLKSFSMIYLKDNDLTGYILFTLRHDSLSLRDNTVKENSTSIIEDFEYVLDLIKNDDIHLSDFDIYGDEINEILTKYKATTVEPRISDLAFTIYQELNRTERRPDSAVDIESFVPKPKPPTSK